MLTITEYNLIVHFADFCNKMSAIEKSKNIVFREFVKMEAAFLKITRDQKIPELIISALSRVLVFYNKVYVKNNADFDKMMKKLEYFFIPNFYYPSFYDLILAFNMAHYRQYLNWPDLYRSDFNLSEQNKFYECSEIVFGEIMKYIGTMKAEIDTLSRDKNRIEWLKNLSEIKSIEYPDIIVKFYESNRHDWTKDGEDMLLLILILIEDIIIKLDDMLHNEWTLMDNKEKMVNMRVLRGNEIEVLYNKLKTDYDLAKTKHLNNLPLKIPLREFFRREFSESLFTDNNQKYIYNKMVKMFGYLRELSLVLKKYYDPLGDQKSDTDFNKFMVVSPQEWRGEPVFSVFKFYILLFLQICGYFRENDLLSDIKKLQEIDRKLAERKEKIGNIMGNDDFIRKFFENDESRAQK